MYIKSLKGNGTNYTRFGKIIPLEKLELESLKEFFKKSPLTEEKLLAALSDDRNVFIETEADKEQNDKRIVISDEDKKKGIRDLEKKIGLEEKTFDGVVDEKQTDEERTDELRDKSIKSDEEKLIEAVKRKPNRKK